MICPKCECEYVDGIKVCSDCGIDLIPGDEFEGNLVHPKDWVIVYTDNDLIDTEMLKANLNGAEIESIILSQKDRSYLYLGEVSPIKLLVKRKDADEALQIINDIFESKVDDEE